MNKEEFLAQSNELFHKIRTSMCESIIEDAKPIFENAKQAEDKSTAIATMQGELAQMMSLKSFEASCDYSEKLALLLFEHFSK